MQLRDKRGQAKGPTERDCEQPIVAQAAQAASHVLGGWHQSSSALDYWTSIGIFLDAHGCLFSALASLLPAHGWHSCAVACRGGCRPRSACHTARQPAVPQQHACHSNRRRAAAAQRDQDTVDPGPPSDRGLRPARAPVDRPGGPVANGGAPHLHPPRHPHPPRCRNKRYVT